MCSVTCSCSKTGLGLIFRSFTTMAGVPFLHSKKVRRGTAPSPMLSPLGANKFPNAMGLERSLPGLIEEGMSAFGTKRTSQHIYAISSAEADKAGRKQCVSVFFILPL